MRRKNPTKQPARCGCNVKVDTPQWVGARRTGSGLGQHSTPAHGNPFTGSGNCVHSDLIRTTRPPARRRLGKRLRIA